MRDVASAGIGVSTKVDVIVECADITARPAVIATTGSSVSATANIIAAGSSVSSRATIVSVCADIAAGADTVAVFSVSHSGTLNAACAGRAAPAVMCHCGWVCGCT